MSDYTAEYVDINGDTFRVELLSSKHVEYADLRQAADNALLELIEKSKSPAPRTPAGPPPGVMFNKGYGIPG